MVLEFQLKAISHRLLERLVRGKEALLLLLKASAHGNALGGSCARQRGCSPPATSSHVLVWPQPLRRR